MNRIRKLQQNFNIAGVLLFTQVLRKKELALAHLDVKTINDIPWRQLRRAGFKGVIFDKDNTLTLPYQDLIYSDIVEGLERCKSAFRSNIVVFSNSAGLVQFDPKGNEAKQLEERIGISVLRHKSKKPGGDCVELEQYFGCQCHQLIMVGDRQLTDIVYGNRFGMLTIKVEPFTDRGETISVKMVRRIEDRICKRWVEKGIQPPNQALLQSNQLPLSWLQ
eukprot:TRINITY_DN44823_c0_g1_i1.p1 TRINITY_DN44823_c0_g1~~TRINITY_DN44823_c0_g1_i1.p1  ORF type:complete len:236 (-),score=12.28 TRINITY_DN44823_c0_g1_i1:610-1269(-)